MNEPIKLPVTLTAHPKDKPRPGLAFVYEGEAWTVTAISWRGQMRYRIGKRADGSGEWHELTADELAAMLSVSTHYVGQNSREAKGSALDDYQAGKWT